MKMYAESKIRIQKELNVVKLIKSMYLMRTLLKNSILTDELKYGCIHSKKGTIHLDKSDEEFINGEKAQKSHYHGNGADRSS